MIDPNDITEALRRTNAGKLMSDEDMSRHEIRYRELYERRDAALHMLRSTPKDRSPEIDHLREQRRHALLGAENKLEDFLQPFGLQGTVKN